MASEMASEPEEFAEVPESEKTPVTVITGFLGAGKTTLVNYILTQQTEWRIAIIENEFGEVNIDEGLVADQIKSKEDIISMDNGCICCTVRGDLVRTLNGLAARRKDFHAIILETTGLADPAPIIQTFNSDTAIMDNFRIDSIVCLVDAKNVTAHLREVKADNAVNEAVQQVDPFHLFPSPLDTACVFDAWPSVRLLISRALAPRWRLRTALC
jgi:G3E family GTPase